MNSVTEQLLREKLGQTYSKDCVLLLTDSSEFKILQNKIADEDLYTEDDKYGKENEPHITILYGLLPGEYKTEQVEDILNSYIRIQYYLKGVSLFENENNPYDVVKIDVVSDDLFNINDALKELPYQNDYPDYHPHMTLAYVKKGTGKKYIEPFKNLVGEVAYRVKLSHADGTFQVFDLTDNRIQQEVTTSAMIAAPPGDYSFYQKDKEKADNNGVEVIRPQLP